jgi:hypothetical protein
MLRAFRDVIVIGSRTGMEHRQIAGAKPHISAVEMVRLLSYLPREKIKNPLSRSCAA